MLVVGLIDIQHMQSVIKGFFFFFFFFFFFSKIATILVIWKHSDLETPQQLSEGVSHNIEEKCSALFQSYSRWCPRGGVPRDPSVENHFPTGILQWNLHHMCMDYKKSQFWKKFLKCCTVSKWRPNNRFLFRPGFRLISILAKIWKTTFPKEFFKKIWLKVGEY